MNLPSAVRREWRVIRLRRDLRRQLAAAKIEGPTPMTEVCERLGKLRGKPIRLMLMPMDVPGPFGLWLSTAAADFIVVQRAGTTWLHREHIIAHELGHLLADHPTGTGDDSVWQELMPDIPLEMIRGVLQRTTYDNRFEEEAETLATVLLEATAKAQSVTLPGYSSRARRAQTALGDPIDLL